MEALLHAMNGVLRKLTSACRARKRALGHSGTREPKIHSWNSPPPSCSISSDNRIAKLQCLLLDVLKDFHLLFPMQQLRNSSPLMPPAGSDEALALAHPIERPPFDEVLGFRSNSATAERHSLWYSSHFALTLCIQMMERGAVEPSVPTLTQTIRCVRLVLATMFMAVRDPSCYNELRLHPLVRHTLHTLGRIVERISKRGIQRLLPEELRTTEGFVIHYLIADLHKYGKFPVILRWANSFHKATPRDGVQ